MGVNARVNNEDQVLYLTVWDTDKGRAFTEERIPVPFDEVRKVITALVGVYGFVDVKNEAPLFKDANIQEVERLTAEVTDLKRDVHGANMEIERYYELLYCVEKKTPGESRHETAKRYIQEREN